MNTTKKISFTNEALKQINKIVLENSPKKYFRISVLGGGCSGFKYNFTFDDKQEVDDIIFDKTIIDKNSLDIINGSSLIYFFAKSSVCKIPLVFFLVITILQFGLIFFNILSDSNFILSA